MYDGKSSKGGGRGGYGEEGGGGDPKQSQRDGNDKCESEYWGVGGGTCPIKSQWDTVTTARYFIPTVGDTVYPPPHHPLVMQAMAIRALVTTVGDIALPPL